VAQYAIGDQGLVFFGFSRPIRLNSLYGCAEKAMLTQENTNEITA